MYTFQMRYILVGVMKVDFILKGAVVLHMLQKILFILESLIIRIKSDTTVSHLLVGTSSHQFTSMILEMKMGRWCIRPTLSNFWNKLLLEQGKDFVLFEDNDSGHGTSKKNSSAWVEREEWFKDFTLMLQTHLISILLRIAGCHQRTMYTSFLIGMTRRHGLLLLRAGNKVSQEFVNGMMRTYPQWCNCYGRTINWLVNYVFNYLTIYVVESLMVLS